MTDTGPRGHAALPPLPRPLLQLLRRSPITVFVVGGTSEQREQTARRLHHESIVHDGPFVAVDCSTEEPTLHAGLEAWCAGTPGDVSTDPVARASGGTLFLDAIESLTPESQRMLLEVQRKEGGTPPGRPRWAARLIVGNARDLSTARYEGKFDAALHDAIDQFRVTLS